MGYHTGGLKMDYQAEIKRLQELAAAEDKQRRADQQAAWEYLVRIPENWEWQTSSRAYAKVSPFHRFTGCEHCLVEKRLKADILEKWKSQGLSTFSNEWMDGRWLGMWYVRTEEGILTHEGGGHCILDDPRLCSEDEWDALCSGNIPEKFIR